MVRRGQDKGQSQPFPVQKTIVEGKLKFLIFKLDQILSGSPVTASQSLFNSESMHTWSKDRTSPRKSNGSSSILIQRLSFPCNSHIHAAERNRPKYIGDLIPKSDAIPKSFE